MSVKTPKSDSLESQLQSLVERFDRFTEQDEMRWATLLDSLGDAKSPAKVAASSSAASDVDARFLKANDLFSGISDDELAQFISFGHLKTYKAGEVLFEGGGACDRVFAISHGVLEISRPSDGQDATVALLGTGEVLGMLGVLTGGRHRSSGRFPEGGEVFELDAAGFNAAIESTPGIAAAITRSLARRLIGAVQRGDMSRAKKRQLEGSLAHFDLSTILQSLFTTDACSGVLRIINKEGQKLGEIGVGDGRILACCAGKLADREAFQALFLADNSENRFSFEETDVDSARVGSGSGLAALSGAGLLMDCARISDELNRIRSGPLGDKDRKLSRGKSPGDWDEPATRSTVREIWKFVDGDVTVKEILAQNFSQEHHVYRLLHMMMEAGYLA